MRKTLSDVASNGADDTSKAYQVQLGLLTQGDNWVFIKNPVPSLEGKLYEAQKFSIKEGKGEQIRYPVKRIIEEYGNPPYNGNTKPLS